MTEQDIEQVEEKRPVYVSGDAIRDLTKRVRQWTGWDNAVLSFEDPIASPFASLDFRRRKIRAAADALVRNPNRVLLSITPFRLRQEAVLTGALLHEAAHARFSLWMPTTKAEREALRHDDGAPVSDLALALAKVMEEARIEGMMTAASSVVGAEGYDWTMRASAAALLSDTELSDDPDQRILDIITSWTLRAGRRWAVAYLSGKGTLPGRGPLEPWVGDFNDLLHSALTEHFTGKGVDNPTGHAISIQSYLLGAMRNIDCEGTFMLDTARSILNRLFPNGEGDSEDGPQIESDCGAGQEEGGDKPESGSEAGQDGKGDEEGQDGEGDTEPEDPGSGEQPGAGDSGLEDGEDEGQGADQDSEGDEGDQDADGSGDGQTDPKDDASEGDDSEGEGNSDEGDSDEGDSDEGDSDEGDSDEGTSDSPERDPATEALAHTLTAIEEEANSSATKEEAAAIIAAGDGAGEGKASSLEPGWRHPTKEEREHQRGAEKFLRGLIEPSEASKVTLTDTPSAMVDGAALAAWKAGSQRQDPRFFKRTRREVQPSPPVKIAVLVDVSSSMDEMQQPSALLSWALSAAAEDLQNFAGRGQQIESTLIHWGSIARVVKPVNKSLPGLREIECREGTIALHNALALVEEQIPGFFDQPEKPVNRLLVQFTDWQLMGGCAQPSADYIRRGLNSGMNMLSVVPSDYSARYADLDDIVRGAMFATGQSTTLRYNSMFPEQVWEAASEALT